MRSLHSTKKSGPHSPQPEKTLSSNEDPAQLKIQKQMNLLFFFFKEDYCKNPIEIRWYLRLGRWESGEMASVCTLCRVPRVCWSLNQKHTGERSIRDDSKCLAEGRLGRLYEEMIWRRNQVFCLDMLHLRCLLTSAWKGWVVLDMSQKFQREVMPGAMKLNCWPKVRVIGKEIQGLSPGAFQNWQGGETSLIAYCFLLFHLP